MPDARHRAQRDVQVIIVEVPAAGSPEPQRQVKPRYPQQQRREAWRPATRPPNRSKSEALRRLIDAISRNDEAARSVMRPNPTLLKASTA